MKNVAILALGLLFLATTATAGSATLPAQPQGYINIIVNGQPYKVPYYNQ